MNISYREGIAMMDIREKRAVFIAVLQDLDNIKAEEERLRAIVQELQESNE